MDETFPNEEMNALMQAIKNASGGDTNKEIYDFLQKMPKHSLVVYIVDELNSLGYSIIKK